MQKTKFIVGRGGLSALLAAHALGAGPSELLAAPPLAPKKRTLPPGYQYIGRPGRQAQARAMRQSYRRALKLRDEASRAAMERIHAAAAEEDGPQLAACALAHAALVASEERGISWAAAVDQLLQQLEESAAPGPLVEAAVP